MRSIPILLVVCTATVAAADPPVVRFEQKPDGSIQATTPKLTAGVNELVSYLAHVRTGYPSAATWHCENGVMNTQLVSVRCSARAPTNSGIADWIAQTYFVAMDDYTPISMDDVVRSPDEIGPQLAALHGKLEGSDKPCALSLGPDQLDAFFVTEQSVEVVTGIHAGCVFALRDFMSIAKPSTPFAAAATAILAGTVTAMRSTKARFVAIGSDSVRDTSTGIEWAAHDNGADLTADAADAFATAYRGGGHGDWRLPSIDELAAISLPELAHREPKDCTGGKDQYLITPLIHVSCGLAWSSSQYPDGTAAFGFISGKPRASKRSETKNYRALVVRSP